MGRILSIQGETETILDPVEDLDQLIEHRMGVDARDLFREILQDKDDEIAAMKRECEEQDRDDPQVYQDIIDTGRANLDYLMGRIRTSGMIDKDELLRELKNIYWDMGY